MSLLGSLADRLATTAYPFALLWLMQSITINEETRSPCRVVESFMPSERLFQWNPSRNISTWCTAAATKSHKNIHIRVKWKGSPLLLLEWQRPFPRSGLCRNRLSWLNAAVGYSAKDNMSGQLRDRICERWQCIIQFFIRVSMEKGKSIFGGTTLFPHHLSPVHSKITLPRSVGQARSDDIHHVLVWSDHSTKTSKSTRVHCSHGNIIAFSRPWLPHEHRAIRVFPWITKKEHIFELEGTPATIA